MNENEVGAKHLVMIITNDVFCNKYGYDRQGKKGNFRMRRRNIYARAFHVLSSSRLSKAARAALTESLDTKWVVVMQTYRTARTTENGITSDEIPLVQCYEKGYTPMPVKKI
jgi:hypothetical protein